jgi:hypothetical protein
MDNRGKNAYLLLRVGQVLPFTGESRSRLLHREVLEVAAFVALLQKPQIGSGGKLDQALILKAKVLGVTQSTEMFASSVCLLDLKRCILLDPGFVGGFVGSPVFLGLIDESLLL